MGTCAQEKHLIAPVGCIHLVHGDGGEPVGGARADHQGPPLQGVHGLVHERVAAHEVDHLVGVVLGGLHGRCEGPARTLQAGERIRPGRLAGLPGPTAAGEASVCLPTTSPACSSARPGACPAPASLQGPLQWGPQVPQCRPHGHLPGPRSQVSGPPSAELTTPFPRAPPRPALVSLSSGCSSPHPTQPCAAGLQALSPFNAWLCPPLPPPPLPSLRVPLPDLS